MSLLKRTMYFVDGENLVFRFQDEVKNGRIPKEGVIHIPDVFIWHADIVANRFADILRITYYASTIGDDLEIQRIKDRIHSISYTFTDGQMNASGELVPRVYKKPKNQQRLAGWISILPSTF